ncbi:hypothetical protein BBO99_00004407 [Phytophthora kernoviae]|uniref:Wbp11/ELF5/Saf1 N-terminal domain-containing protein n=1 Tax=Phytophthora kernoviae TaxID=325452 RepID=A0A3R7JUT3_9STRA|nr:hypothetical protein JM16_004932 [Phytophthora kernoviae]RLN38315.1 hypothetical protein BBI17_004770 [Phytophthora kernoviae]RLN80557.1 hypothetical protein BBO99_00004407 [Phytophthora kernoviae]
MGLAIVTILQEKTRWVVSKLPFKKLRLKKRSRKAKEATELQPIALAGASKGFTGSSRQCNELKKHRLERQKDKLSKLSSMDTSELKEQLKNLEKQVISNPTDGPTRKRKQELEDTLRAVVKKQKEMAEEERKRQADAPPPPPMSMTELAEANKEKFQNPENSIYYHPTLNPFGAPPPGMPQRYHGMPPASAGPMGAPRVS